LKAGNVKIERFEDIEAWKAARELTQRIYALTSQPKFAKDFGLRDQIQRAAVSIMANIAEGFDGRSTREFIRFLGYAFRSATEVQSHLYVALDQAYFMKDEFEDLYQQAIETKKLINGFIRYLRKAAR
jgi:four helix bundle protein